MPDRPRSQATGAPARSTPPPDRPAQSPFARRPDGRGEGPHPAEPPSPTAPPRVADAAHPAADDLSRTLRDLIRSLPGRPGTPPAAPAGVADVGAPLPDERLGSSRGPHAAGEEVIRPDQAGPGQASLAPPGVLDAPPPAGTAAAGPAGRGGGVEATVTAPPLDILRADPAGSGSPRTAPSESLALGPAPPPAVGGMMFELAADVGRTAPGGEDAAGAMSSGMTDGVVPSGDLLAAAGRGAAPSSPATDVGAGPAGPGGGAWGPETVPSVGLIRGYDEAPGRGPDPSAASGGWGDPSADPAAALAPNATPGEAGAQPADLSRTNALLEQILEELRRQQPSYVASGRSVYPER